MKIIRFESGLHFSYGVLKDDIISIIEGDIFDTYSVTNQSVRLSEVKILPPVSPTKIVCVGLNYLEHSAEMNDYAKDFPKLFIKPSTAIIAHNEKIGRASCRERV